MKGVVVCLSCEMRGENKTWRGRGKCVCGGVIGNRGVRGDGGVVGKC